MHSKASYIIVIVMAIAMAMGGCTSKKSVAKPRPHRVSRITHTVEVTDKQTERLIKEARKWIGTPYRYGGHSMSGTDCSGLVMELFSKVYDIKLPRSSSDQQQYCIPLNEKDLRPGDLVFFATGRSSAVSHVGLYIGKRRMIHASASRGVMESGLDEKYFRRTYYSSGRVVKTGGKEKKSGKKEQKAQPAPAADANPPRNPQREITLEELKAKSEQHRLEKLQQTLESRIDSLYVTDPAIFD